MSTALLFAIGSVIFFAVFAAALSFAYATAVRLDRTDEEGATETVAARFAAHPES